MVFSYKLDFCYFECSPNIVGHNEVMTKPATVISTSIRGEICFKFRDFSPGIPGFEMTSRYDVFIALIVSVLWNSVIGNLRHEDEKSTPVKRDFSLFLVEMTGAIEN
jgi:hypothetical protein